MTEDKGGTYQTTNSVRVIRADGHAVVQVGDNHYHNYPDPSRPTRASIRTKFLRQLSTFPYEQRKDRNPRRADGTCQWFTTHHLFQHWQNEASALLWVSADPGCGKSVLAKYLVDEFFPPTASRITCYFFFKDDFDDQRTLEDALRCILRQLFTQLPALLSDEILEDYEVEGDQYFASFSRLWGTLIRVARRHGHGEIICILDALDECIEQKPLVQALVEHYSRGERISNMKFLVTSRPYRQIHECFHYLKESQPTIHLSGDGELEAHMIAKEIKIAIEHRIEELCKMRKFTDEEKQILYEELATYRHRTYLWVYLIFSVIEDSNTLSKHELRTSIRKLPRTVEEAYDRILSKSRDPDKAKNILSMIVAANRPLHLPEMSAMLAFRHDSHRCYADLEKDLLPPDRLRSEIREICGLFVVIQDSRVFLLHQTAREFLVRSSQPSPTASVRSSPLVWQYSLELRILHLMISDICIRYLLLDDSMGKVGSRQSTKSEKMNHPVLLDYAASNWADHYRKAHKTHDTDLDRLALQLCDTNAPACSSWLEIYGGNDQTLGKRVCYELSTPLLIASFFGLDRLVDLILKDKKPKLDTKSHDSQRTALSWACVKGHDLVVRSLLGKVSKRQAFFGDKLSMLPPTIVNQVDAMDMSPLCYSAANGHEQVVRSLLKKGARVDTKNKIGLTALSWATIHDHRDIITLLIKYGAQQETEYDLSETTGYTGQTLLSRAVGHGNQDVVRLLLESGTEVNASSIYFTTALIQASTNGDEAIVKILLDSGAAVDASDNSSWTALIQASRMGYKAIVKMLLDSGATVNASNNNGTTALIEASRSGNKPIVKMLLDSGAAVNASDNHGGAALLEASTFGHETIVKMLLDSGAAVNASDIFSWTALTRASEMGYEAIVKILLDSGATVNASDNEGWTALIRASRMGNEAIVKILLDSGAEVDVSDEKGRTALIWASQNGHEATVKILLDGGAAVNASNDDGRTALIWASQNGHEAIVKILLDSGAAVNTSNNDGLTALIQASRNGSEAIVKILLDSGATVNASDANHSTAINYATHFGHEGVASLLRSRGAEVY